MLLVGGVVACSPHMRVLPYHLALAVVALEVVEGEVVRGAGVVVGG